MISFLNGRSGARLEVLLLQESSRWLVAFYRLRASGRAVALMFSHAVRCVAFASIAALFGCGETSRPAKEPVAEPPASVQRANPASINYVEKGGTGVTESTPGGDQYRVCIFPDNLQCEEWALLRGECQPGGIRVTGYVTSAARYCAITGGKYSAVAWSGTASEQGNCLLPGGNTCDADAYYNGTCTRQ